MSMVEMEGVFTPVDAPPAVAYRYGLFSVAVPTPDAGVSWEGFGMTWTSEACALPFVTYDPCIVDEVPGLARNVVFCTFPQWQPFTVYTVTDATLRKWGETDGANRARLLEVEQFGVEEQLWAELVAAVLAPVATTDLVEGLAVVEQLLVERYPAQGVIHLSRYTAIRLGENLVREGGRLTTVLGTPVVAGGGYDPIALGGPPADATIFGTGPIVLRRGQVDSNRVPDTQVNTVHAQAFRTYVVGWDCAVVGTTVTFP